ncbi:MAG: phosphoadenosine phosphosulfate reductase family protein [Thermoplasmata archaeon]
MVQKVVLLLSAGIDSPVAAHLLAEVGMEVKLLYLDTRPFTDDRTVDLVHRLAERLIKLHPDIEFYTSDFSEVEKAIAGEANSHFQCILCRRMMYRAAARLAKKIGAHAIATGESLGQVASQTLSNLVSEDQAVDITIHRPLIGLDKEEVIRIAKEIRTFDTSTRPAVCCMLVPEGPRVNSTVKEVTRQEEGIKVNKLIEGLIFEKKGD